MRSFIVSHNTRIQCLVEGIQPHFGIITTNKTRFQNCVILKLELGPTYAALSMVYSGELNSRERSKVSVDRPYYIKEEDFNTLQTHGVIHKGKDIYGQDRFYRPTPQEIAGYMNYPSKRTTSAETLIHIRNALKLHTPEEHVFYLIRHGQAEHNQTTKVIGVKVSNTFGVKLDTEITKEDQPADLPESGKWQARRAGLYLRNHELKTPATKDIFFVSDLKRTHETAEEIKEIIQNYEMCIVLPCASELSQKGVQGNCDAITADTSIMKKIARENYSACVTTTRGTEVILTPSCNHLVDWRSIYLPFYGNKVRGQEDTLWGSVTLKRYSVNLIKQHCRNTTMISMAACYYMLKRLPYDKRAAALHQFIEEQKVAKPYNTPTVSRTSKWRVGGRKRTFKKHNGYW